MPPMFGQANFDFISEVDSDENDRTEDYTESKYFGQTAFWYMVVLVTLLLIWLLVFFCLRLITLRQKTRNPQQRRVYVGSRSRPSLAPSEPTIYVSPSNLPPPPKYEAMAPPSYEEVVGIHYPNYQAQPITQPISAALAQSSGSQNITYNEPATVTVTTEERRPSVARS